MTRTRRLVALGLAMSVLAALLSVVVAPGFAPTGSAQRESTFVRYHHFRMDTPWGNQRALLMIPRRALSSGERWPLLVALHGMGEARRGPERGFLAWPLDYQLGDAFAALYRGRLVERDYGGLVRAAHLRSANAELARHPFEGVVVVCPYTPDLLGEAVGGAETLRWGEWVAGPLLARVRAELPDLVSDERAATGIDGVSLGGMLSIEVGFRHPEAFGSVGAIQPAIRGREASLAELAGDHQRIRLLSSERDPFLLATRTLSERLRERHVAHEIAVVPGPHDYAFNRGPGGLEMLRFHDRALRSESD